MPYAQDTITSANAADDFVDVLDGLLLAAGWTVVETLTPSGDFRNRVYQSSGLSNLCGYDWYLAVMWTVIGTENYVRVIPFEEYNAGTHVATKFPAVFSEIPSSSSSPGGYKSARADGSITSTSLNLSTTPVSTSMFTVSANYGSSSNQYNAAGPGFQTLIPSSAFGYWMSVTLDHVALWTTVATNYQNAVISTLVLDSTYEAYGLFSDSPIVCWTSGSGTGTSGYFQLSSHLAAGINPTTSSYVALGVTFSGVFGAKLPALSDTYLDAFAWQPYVYLSYMTQGSTNPTPTTQIAGLIAVGQVPDFLMVWGGSVGDTVEVDSATYVLTGALCSNFSSDIRPTLALLVE